MCLENQFKKLSDFKVFAEVKIHFIWSPGLGHRVVWYTVTANVQRSIPQNKTLLQNFSVKYVQYFITGPFITRIPSATEVLKIQTVILEISTAWGQRTRKTFLLRSWGKQVWRWEWDLSWNNIKHLWIDGKYHETPLSIDLPTQD